MTIARPLLAVSLSICMLAWMLGQVLSGTTTQEYEHLSTTVPLLIDDIDCTQYFATPPPDYSSGPCSPSCDEVYDYCKALISNDGNIISECLACEDICHHVNNPKADTDCCFYCPRYLNLIQAPQYTLHPLKQSSNSTAPTPNTKSLSTASSEGPKHNFTGHNETVSPVTSLGLPVWAIATTSILAVIFIIVAAVSAAVCYCRKKKRTPTEKEQDPEKQTDIPLMNKESTQSNGHLTDTSNGQVVT